MGNIYVIYRYKIIREATGIGMRTGKKHKGAIYIDFNSEVIKIVSLSNRIKEYKMKYILLLSEHLTNKNELTIIFKTKDKAKLNNYNNILNEKDTKKYRFEFLRPKYRFEFVTKLYKHTMRIERNLKISNNINTDLDSYSIFLGSWNVGEQDKVNYKELSKWIVHDLNYDIYIIGLQECNNKKEWIEGILFHINKLNYLKNQSTQEEYILLKKEFLLKIGIIIIIRMTHLNKISHLESQTVATGQGNIIGNKGATAISFIYCNTSFVFINSHLAARAERESKRLENFNRIVSNLAFGVRDLDILHQFAHVIWFGDLNYRIERLKFKEVSKIVTTNMENNASNWSELTNCDQLIKNMNEFQVGHDNAVFYGFKEGLINFAPTYRWDRNENIISNKREQPPSYTDRVLYRSLEFSYNLWQTQYNSVPTCYGSDHRPIYSVFKFKPKLLDHGNTKLYKDSEINDIRINFVDFNVKLDDNNDINNNNNNNNINDDNKDSENINNIHDNKKLMIDVVIYYNYCDKIIILKGGKYDDVRMAHIWSIDDIDKCIINPYIKDPSFICNTHIFISFKNSKTNKIIGYSAVSLFNCFPSSLINTKKIKENYFNNQEHYQIKSMTQEQLKYLVNDKQFNVPISKNGLHIGQFEGFINIDGKLIDKHKIISRQQQVNEMNQRQIENQKKLNKHNKTGSKILKLIGL